ncbi:MAG: CHASE2 domain-containing protein [Desulfobacterales bacterium]|nr:CHASE2 domain-containing protein [Desulfobacterales bacterium]
MAVESGKKAPGKGASRFFRALAGGRGRPAAAALLLLIAAAFAVFGADGWEPARRVAFDGWQRIFPRQVTRFPVVIVDIDEESLAALGRWPWPRTRLAQLAEAARRLGAEAVAFDIIMPEPDRLSPELLLADRPDAAEVLHSVLSRLPSNDEILAQTLREIPSVVARAALIGGKPDKDSTSDQTPVMIVGDSPIHRVTAYSGHLANLSSIENAASGCGYLNDTRDDDGVVRTMPLVIAVDGNLAPSLSVELLRTAARANWYSVIGGADGVEALQVGDRIIPTDSSGQIRLYFSPAYQERRVSALSVLQDKVDAGSFDGHVVIIGVTAVGTVDVVSTPVAARMDGVEIQAQVVENIIDNLRLTRPAGIFWMEFAIFLMVGACFIGVLPRLHPAVGVFCFLGFAAISAAVSMTFFIHGRLLVDPSFPVAGNLLVFVVLLSAGFAAARRRQMELDAALEVEKLERVRMAGELQAARTIQMGMLPDPCAIERLSPRIDFFAMLEPAEEVGGDLYDAFMIDERRFFFLVGDVAGKGVAASLFMALSKTLCKSTALRGELSLAEMIGKLNREISRENPAMLFVTAVAGILDAADGNLQICCAGHETPVLIRPGQAPCMIDVEAGPPLCVIDGYRYSENQMVLTPGDLLVLISDGITEAQNSEQKFYGRHRVLDQIAALGSGKQTAEEACRKLYADVKAFSADAGQSDDITVMAVGLRQGQRPDIGHPMSDVRKQNDR